MPPQPLRVDDETAREALLDLYRRHRLDHIYAIADLAEPYWSRSTWWRRGDAAVGLVGLGDNEHVVYAVSSADPDGTLTLLGELASSLPACLVTGPLGLGKRMRAAGRTLVWNRTYHRYHWPLGRQAPAADVPTRRLGVDDLPTISALHATDPGAAFFVRSMLDSGVYVGVEQDDRLIAVGGTHVRTSGEAAIGGVLVDPGHRGRGLGRAVTIGVIDALLSDAPEPDFAIGLNCTDRNEPAKAIYLDLGFLPGLAYEECELG